MRNKIISTLLVASMVSFPCYAGKESSSSSSSSRSSSSRPSSSSSNRSSNGSKYSSPKPTSPSKPTYSAPKPTSPSKPTYSAPKSTSPSKPTYSAPKSTPSTNVPSNKYSTPKSTPSTKPAVVNKPPVATPPVAAKPNNSVKPSSSNFNAQAAESQQRELSKQKYIAAQPKTSYKDPRGNVRPIDVNKPAVQEIRKMDYNTYSTRQQRASKVYSPTIINNYNNTPRVYYHDHYSDLFMTWLITRSISDQAMWYYAHRNDMDRARWDSAMRDNAELRARVAALEQQKVNVSHDYVPNGIDKDLMYNDDYVSAVYNPSPVESGSNSLLVTFFLIVSFVLIVCLVIWAVFIKDWKTGA